MTDQEFDKELAALMSDEDSGKKKKGRMKLKWRFWKSWSRKRKIITGVAAAAVALVAISKVAGGNKEMGMPVMTAPLEKGDIEEMLSISGPVSGTDSAEVVSRLHAEILEILVKEGDQVKAGQVLARLDPTDLHWGCRGPRPGRGIREPLFGRGGRAPAHPACQRHWIFA